MLSKKFYLRKFVVPNIVYINIKFLLRIKLGGIIMADLSTGVPAVSPEMMEKMRGVLFAMRHRKKGEPIIKDSADINCLTGCLFAMIDKNHNEQIERSELVGKLNPEAYLQNGQDSISIMNAAKLSYADPSDSKGAGVGEILAAYKIRTQEIKDREMKNSI